MANSTIFDDVFQTIKEKMSERSWVRLWVDRFWNWNQTD